MYTPFSNSEREAATTLEPNRLQYEALLIVTLLCAISISKWYYLFGTYFSARTPTKTKNACLSIRTIPIQASEEGSKPAGREGQSVGGPED